MPSSDKIFAGAAERFAEYAHDVRGHVRYEVTHRNLQEIVEGGPLQVADIGGGAAIDAVWLARLGHAVTLVEPEKGQQAKARRRIEESNLGESVQLIEGTMADIPSAQVGDFDLVLSHGVAMYTPSPKDFIQGLVNLVKPGGHVSLLEKGYHGARARLFHQKAPIEDIRKFQAREPVENNVGKERVAFLPEELQEMLQQAGAKVLRWSGVRVFSDQDNTRINMVDPEFLEALVEAEYEQGKDDNIRGSGQMLHFIAQKPR